MATSSYLQLFRTMHRLSLDSPTVIGARMAMLSQAGNPSRRDCAEVGRMFAEKQSAAMESCMSFWIDASQQYQRSIFEFWSAALTGSGTRMLHAGDVSTDASLSSANRMLKPYQRRASANARRLAKA